MTPTITARKFGFIASALALVLAMPGCDAIQRVQDVGAAPILTVIENLTTKPTYRRVSMPMPTPVALQHQENSLWRPGSKAFFKDRRAAMVGDILTITVTVDDEADISNRTTRTRTNSEDLGLDQLLGYQGSLAKSCPPPSTMRAWWTSILRVRQWATVRWTVTKTFDSPLPPSSPKFCPTGIWSSRGVKRCG